MRIQAAASSGCSLPVYASKRCMLSLCVQFLMKNEEFMKTMVYY
ncbi:hypothetical protein HMPREF9406_3801 [Clostridium sp. HGF2]|nr:hypothetical protein HMPREF9406_3801 [Clostridium sp. HGF2]EQJ56194.1 hypothetical protein QSI_2364 [Clostridioides difficile P28]